MLKSRVLVLSVVWFTLFITNEGIGQADPSWLLSWEEAQRSQPQVLSSTSRIAGEEEPGSPFLIRGRIVNPDGLPSQGVVVHAYHRDNEGYDFGKRDAELTTWGLQGWAQTDAEGRFQFRTIRPKADHLQREAAHIHFTIVSKAYGRQWAPKVFLVDDPLVTERQRRRSEDAGEWGWVREVTEVQGLQQIEVKIKLREKADF